MRAILHHRHAAWLTHGLLLVMLTAYFALLVVAPLWLALVPGVLLVHRIGIMGHEYIHGIPCRSYRRCLAVVTALDGMMLMFGVYELYRGMHLAHHRWLNGPGDPATDHVVREGAAAGRGVRGLLGSGEVAKHLRLYAQGIRGQHPFAKARRIGLGVLASLAWIAVWVALGHPEVPGKGVVILVATVAGPASLRAAVEHSSAPDDPGFANEYRVVLTLFNLDKHVHHHLEPGLPWYLLEYQGQPLPRRAYFTYWYRVHVARDFIPMKPMPMKPTPTTTKN